jgi:hypothetical protein
LWNFTFSASTRCRPVPLRSCFPLFADRLARRLLGFLGGSLVRVQFRYDLIERTAHNRATLLPLRRL